MLSHVALFALVSSVLGQKPFKADGHFPATGDDPVAGGIFSITLPDLAVYLVKNGGMAKGPEAVPAGPYGPGTGPYPAYMFTDSSLPMHTIYAPKTPPKGIKMPFIAWGNGACGTNGAGYKNFLTEIASHGYIIAADGAPAAGSGGSSALGLSSGGSGGQSKPSDMTDSIKWATSGKAAKHGEVDTDKIVTAGHSCGGLEAMSNAYHNEKVVKLIMMFNIAIFQDNKRYLLKEIKQPVAWFVGGKTDMGFPNVSYVCDRVLTNRYAKHQTSRRTRTTIYCQRVCQLISLRFLQAIWLHTLRLTAGSLAKLLWLIWNGNSGTARKPKLRCSKRALAVWRRTIGPSRARIGLE